jgi:iron(III) transport system permease protein
VLLWGERYSRRKQHFYTQGSSVSKKGQVPFVLKGWKAWLAFGYCSLVFTLAFVLPIGQLILWVIEHRSRIWQGVGGYGVELQDLWQSLLLSGMGAGLTVFLALVLAYAQRVLMLWEQGSVFVQKWLSSVVLLATTGYALPGAVLAVGTYLTFSYFGWAEGIWVVLMAYSIRFLSVGYQPLERGFLRIRPEMDTSARSLGATSNKVLWSIHWPLLRPALGTGFLLVFVDVMKELPVTLMTRPFGWNTLAVKIFELTSEGEFERAAWPALCLILAGLVPVIGMIRWSRGN